MSRDYRARAGHTIRVGSEERRWWWLVIEPTGAVVLEGQALEETKREAKTAARCALRLHLAQRRSAA